LSVEQLAPFLKNTHGLGPSWQRLFLRLALTAIILRIAAISAAMFHCGVQVADQSKAA